MSTYKASARETNAVNALQLYAIAGKEPPGADMKIAFRLLASFMLLDLTEEQQKTLEQTRSK